MRLIVICSTMALHERPTGIGMKMDVSIWLSNGVEAPTQRVGKDPGSAPKVLFLFGEGEAEGAACDAQARW